VTNSSSTLVFPEVHDDFFANDAEWFSLGASQSFSLGNFNYSAQPMNTAFEGELDAVEHSVDSMMVDDGITVKTEPKDSVREIPERLHDAPNSLIPSIRNVPISHSNSKAHSPQSTTLTFSSDEDEACEPRSRKRPRIEVDAPEPSSVKNIKSIADKLTALDSDTFEDYVNRLESLRKLSSAEQNEVKKMRRRIHNRESARKSRQDKRDHTDLLDIRIRQLTDQLHETKLEVASLASENQLLRNEIAFSYHLITNNPILSQLYADLKEKHEAKQRQS